MPRRYSGRGSLFDDFSSGTAFDPGRWSMGGQRAEIVAGALELSQRQSDAPVIANLNLFFGASALQADVQVLQWSHTGTGQVGARLTTALNNDGWVGLGTPPDVSGVSSQVGDVMAQISMSDTDVSYAVVRCSVAVCAAGTGSRLHGRLDGVDPGRLPEREEALVQTVMT